jgi:hypothetical protein
MSNNGEEDNDCTCPDDCTAKIHECICSVKKEWGEYGLPNECIATRHICICWEVIKETNKGHVPINQNKCRVTSSNLHKH